ncbi:MAG: peptidylprolyl isomerase [Puniceicoccaceae bacterium]|nr:MAG: peptidylprolyl isomerase [Puniceicoccaceae bacterium]
MKSVILPAAAALLLASASSLSAEDRAIGARFANGIAAIVEDRIITVEDIRREIVPILPQIEAQSRNRQELMTNLQQVEDDIIQNLADQILIVKEFYSDEKRRIPRSFIENEIAERIITQFDGDRSRFLAYLRSIGRSPREYRRIVEEEIIVGYMRGQMRRSQSIVSPVRIERFYEENKERFYQGDSVHLRLIRLAQLADEDPSLLEQTAETILRRLNEGTPFADLARTHSQDTRRNRGGDWGWINRDDLRAELAEVAFSLEPGQFSEAIKLGQDIYLLYVEDRRHAGIQPLSEVRDQIERFLVSQMAREAHERWLERLRRNAYIRFFTQS